MKTILANYKIFILLVPILVLTSCSEIGLLSEKNSWIVDNIDSVGDFLKVYFVLQVSIILVSVLLGFLLDRLGYIISLVIHFVWIVSTRDYGFFKVLLLFGLFTIVSILINLIRGGNRQKYY